MSRLKAELAAKVTIGLPDCTARRYGRIPAA
jgi:hypothetical protein